MIEISVPSNLKLIGYEIPISTKHPRNNDNAVLGDWQENIKNCHMV